MGVLGGLRGLGALRELGELRVLSSQSNLIPSLREG